ncbi:MAG: guanylate kinase [Clostridia bacterium]|nr:guanylate kinase [Clostridia bacterium]
MRNNKNGLLVVFSGPSGCGKSTILAEYMKDRSDCVFSVSATTRAPRPGERDGVDYYFVTRRKFETMLAKGQLLEHTVYNDNYYGTPLKPVLSAIKKGKDVVFDIEIDGAFQVRERYPEAVLIFLKPPSMEVLRGRLEGRGTETAEVIDRRMARAAVEMERANEYDYVVVSDTVEQAAADLGAAIESARAKAE